MATLENIIKRPLITEKTAAESEKYNRYGFYVELKTTKGQIKQAIESLYNVKVLNVKTSILPGKLKRAGKSIKKSAKRKKAFVQLGEGQKIEFFKGI